MGLYNPFPAAQGAGLFSEYVAGATGLSVSPPGQSSDLLAAEGQEGAALKGLAAAADEQKLAELITASENTDWYKKIGREAQIKALEASLPQQLTDTLGNIQDQLLTSADGYSYRGARNNLSVSFIADNINRVKIDNPDYYRYVVPPMIESVVLGNTAYSSNVGNSVANLSPFYHGMVGRIGFVMSTSGRALLSNTNALNKSDYLQDEGKLLRTLVGTTASELKAFAARNTSNLYLMKIESFTCEDIGLGMTYVKKEVPIVNQYFLLRS
tara:strand:- start:65 stop:871 length:807 start_codon:yes stop_codon:yes gene_type:complete